jgi:hypothetical protein
MEDLVNAIAFGCFFLAIGTLVLIFRDAFGRLPNGDQATFQHWIGRKLNLKTRAIDNIWNTHSRAFPKSRKRFLFVLFLIAFVLVGVGYQLWRVIG